MSCSEVYRIVTLQLVFAPLAAFNESDSEVGGKQVAKFATSLPPWQGFLL